MLYHTAYRSVAITHRERPRRSTLILSAETRYGSEADEVTARDARAATGIHISGGAAAEVGISGIDALRAGLVARVCAEETLVHIGGVSCSGCGGRLDTCNPDAGQSMRCKQDSS